MSPINDKLRVSRYIQVVQRNRVFSLLLALDALIESDR